MEQELSVKINADINDLKQGISNAEKEVQTLTDSIKRNKQVIRGLTTSYDRTANKLKDLKSSYDRGETSVKDYTQASDRLENQLQDTSQQIKNYQNEVRRAENAMEDAKSANITYANSTEQVASSTSQAGGAVNNFGNAARGNAVPAMQSFSQTIQDAPYGIQGVANNIQQLTAQFGYLSAQSGGTKAALKGMLASLTGPAGILLAISAVTTLLVAFGDKLFNSKTAAEKAADAYKKAKEELDRFISSLSELDKLDLTTEVNVKIETQRVRNLFEQALGLEGGGEDAQIAAIDALKEKYPVLLKDLNKANISYSDLTKTLKKVNTEFRELNRSQEAQKQWETNIETIEQLEKQVGSIRTELEKSLPKSFWENSAPDGGWENFWDTATLGVNRLVRGFSELSKESGLAENLQKASAEIYRLKQANIKLDAEVGVVIDPDDIQDGLDENAPTPLTLESIITIDPVGLDLSETKKKILNIQELQDTLEESQKAYAQGEGEYIRIEGLIKLLDEAIRKLREGERLVSNFGQTAASGQQVDFSFSDVSPENLLQQNTPTDMEAIKEMQQYMDMQNRLAANTKRTSEAISAYERRMAMVTISAFQQMITSMGNALIEGELTLESFGKMFSKMIVQIIATALAGALANAILTATNAATTFGPLGIIAMPPLVAGAMSGIKGSFSQIPAFADGGIVGGHSYNGDKILSRLNSGELILNQAQQKQLLNMQMNPAVIGGGEVFISDTVIRGEDIVVAYERSQRKTNRIK